MDLGPKQFIFGLLIILMLLVGIPVLVNLTKPKPDYDADAKAMAELQQAVNAYASRSGQYPLEMVPLVPNYIAEIPKTSIGKDFLYDYRTGQVSTPYPPKKGMMTIKPTTGKTPGGMGDALTGLSVSNELNF